MIFDYYFFFFSCDISFVLVDLARIFGYWASSPIKQKNSSIVLKFLYFVQFTLNNTFCFVYYHYIQLFHFWRDPALSSCRRPQMALTAGLYFLVAVFFFLVWFHCVCWNNNRLLCSFWMTWLSVLSVESWLDANWILEVVWVFLCCCYRCCCSISRKIPLETMDSSLPATSLDDTF